MRDNSLVVKKLRKKINSLYRYGHLSRNERDLAFSLLDFAFVESMEEEKILWLLGHTINLPSSFSNF